MQLPHAFLVLLVSVNYRKQPVHMLALSVLPFVSQSSGEAISGGGGSGGGGGNSEMNK